jgi:hypothetical protein
VDLAIIGFSMYCNSPQFSSWAVFRDSIFVLENIHFTHTLSPDYYV